MKPSSLVFISHAGEDTWVARQIANHVVDAGARTFLDVADIQFADAPDRKIREALTEAAELFVLLTPWAIERPWVWIEISLAHYRDRSCPILVVLHGLSRSEFLAIEKIPDFLKTKEIIRLNEVQGYFEGLRKRLRGNDSESTG
jgi:hypothetical protein